MPNWKQEIKTQLVGLKFAPPREAEIVEELTQHLDDCYAELLASGVSEAKAYKAALAQLNESEWLAKELQRVEPQAPSEPTFFEINRRSKMVADLWQDLRYGVRMLAKKPAFTLIAVLTLGLGIGANTAIFSVVNGVLLRPLPYPHADRIVTVLQVSKAGDQIQMAYPNFLDLQSGQSVFDSMSAAVPVGMILTGEGEPERFVGKWITSDFFSTLEIQPQLGRLFTAEEDQRGCELVVVLTHSFWQQRMGGRQDIIGKVLTLNSESWTVIGVLGPDFEFYGQGDTIFYPIGRLLSQEYMYRRTADPLMWMTARLKPEVTLEQAQAEMTSLAARLEQQYPEANANKSVSLMFMYEAYVGDLRSAFLIILGAVAMVLLIACANVANLLLARAATRRKEMALRLALGAGRWRIVRQLLTESLLLAFAGGSAGLLLAKWGIQVLVSLEPVNIPRLDEITLDGQVLLFTLLVTLVAGIIFGLAPALQLTQTNLQDTLKAGGRGSSASGQTLRQALVVAEIALSLLLLVGAGLLLRSFQRLLDVDPGFDPRNVLTMRLRLPDAKYKEAAQTLAFLCQVEEKVAAMPGVEQLSFSSGVPLAGSSSENYQLEDQPETIETNPVAISRSISHGYHQTLGIQLLAGRSFTPQDTENSPMVAIVDEGFVQRHLPEKPLRDALGKRIKFKGEHEPWREIVGIVRRVKQRGLEAQERVEIYYPYLQITPRWLADLTRSMDLAVKTTSDPHGFINLIKTEVQTIDRDQPIANVRTMEEYLTQRSTPRRFNLLLLTLFALIALLLGAVGIYGVMAYSVAQRRQEIGIRIALGAQTRDVLKLIIGQGMRLVIVGVLIGLGGALALTRLMRTLLFGVSTTDPLTFTAIAILLAFVALAACYFPARRATRVDPMTVLRSE